MPPTKPPVVDHLDNYVMTDQPTDCPRCQRRTPFTELPDGTQHHKCGHCAYEFLIHQDFDGQEQCEHCRGFADLDVLEANGGLCPDCVRGGSAGQEEAGGYGKTDNCDD